MPKGGLTINLDSLSFVDELSEIELQDLKERLNYVGYSSTGEKTEIKSIVSLFLEDRSLQGLRTKEELWIELVNYGYKLGDRILTKTNPSLYGGDVEELQELLSRLGFYSEPINGIFTNEVVSSVINFQENRGLAIDGTVGLNTVDEIKRLIRPGFETSLNEAIKTISPGFVTGTIGYSVSFNIPNIGSYKEQVIIYEKIKEVCLDKNIIPSFASEAGEKVEEINVINYINNKQPALFISFNDSNKNLVEHFKGTFSESIVGKKISESIAGEFNIPIVGRSSNLLKNTKSVSIIINGKFYQSDQVEKITYFLLESLNQTLST
tara:strand:+ start:1730 stop:2695 length:966 start_codon:yes stop_codon:yes gene_type:complete